MKINKISRIAVLCCGISAVALPAVSAYAAEAEEDSREIVVTATRKEEKLRDVAMSVNVATGEQLQKLRIFDAKDVAQLAPGLEMTNSTGRNNTTTLRGITFDPDQGTAPAVQVYFNEVPMDAQTVYTALYDIGQVEILRGPQGLLRGLSAPAGSITIATRRPSFDKVEGYLQATGTNRHAYNVQGAVTLPFSDTLTLRAAALVDGNRLNQVRNVNHPQYRSHGSTQSGRLTLGWRPSPSFTAYLTYQHLEADNTQLQQVVGAGNTPAFQPGLFFGIPGSTLTPDTTLRSGPPLAASDYGAVADAPFRVRNRTDVVNLSLNWDLGPATLSFVGARQFTHLRTNRDNDPGNAVPNYIKTSTVETTYPINVGELRLASNNAEGFGWGVGAFYSRQKGNAIVDERSDSFFFPVSTAFGGFLPINTHVVVPINTKVVSFNGTARFKSGPFKIEGGIRYTRSHTIQTTDIFVSSPGNAGYFVAPFSLPPIVGVPLALQDRVYKPFTGGVNASFAITPDINVYAAYGHSFRAGSAGVSVPAGVSNDLILTKPEKTDSYEVGIKGAILDGRVNFAISAFYQKLDNYLSRFTGIVYNCPTSAASGSCTTDPAVKINTPTDITATDGSFDFNYNTNGTIKGVELQLDARPTDNWDLNLNASYARGRFDNARVPCNDFAGTGVPNASGPQKITGSGNVSFCQVNGRIAEVPDFNLSANTEFRFPMETVTPYVRALFTYRPGFRSERVNYDYRSRQLLNLFLGVKTNESGWDLSVFAKNLLNQKRITNISLGTAQQSTSAGIAYDSGYFLANTMNPREFGLTLTKTW